MPDLVSVKADIRRKVFPMAVVIPFLGVLGLGHEIELSPEVLAAPVCTGGILDVDPADLGLHPLIQGACGPGEMTGLSIVHVIDRPEALEDDQLIGILGDVHGRGRFGAGDIPHYGPVPTDGKVTSDLVINRIVLRTGIQEFFDVAYGGSAGFRAKENQGTKTHKQPTGSFFSHGNPFLSLN
jgi:hypothetical protein